MLYFRIVLFQDQFGINLFHLPLFQFELKQRELGTTNALRFRTLLLVELSTAFVQFVDSFCTFGLIVPIFLQAVLNGTSKRLACTINFLHVEVGYEDNQVMK